MEKNNNIRYISTINQLYNANLDIFYYLWKSSIFKYDEYKIAILETHGGFIYKINDIGIDIILMKNKPILYSLKYKDKKISLSIPIPRLPVAYDEYKSDIYDYFDRLLYTIYLCATSKEYRIKKIDDILKYFEEIINE